MDSDPGKVELTVHDDNIIGSGGSGKNIPDTQLHTLGVNIASVGYVWKASMDGPGAERGRQVALKVAYTSKWVANPPLRHEACALLALQGESSEPFYL